MLVLGENHGSGGPILDIRGNLIMVTPLIWILASAVLIIVKHHQNIRRLLNGTEPKFHLKPK
jgi:glycerol-3-phosphate acyltransferase PlsY